MGKALALGAAKKVRGRTALAPARPPALSTLSRAPAARAGVPRVPRAPPPPPSPCPPPPLAVTLALPAAAAVLGRGHNI